MGNNIGFEPSGLDRYSAGIGNIIIPSNVEDRNTYILDCLNNGWVSLYVEGEQIRDRVVCSQEVFNRISFPKEKGELGNIVVWVNDPLKGQMYGVAVLVSPSDFEGTIENSFSLIKKFENNFVEITGNPEKKLLNLTVNGDTNASINLNIGTNDSTGKLNINVKGSVNIQTESGFNISDLTQLGLKVGNKKKSTVVTITDSKVEVNADKIQFNNGSEKMVLGDSLKGILSEILSELGQLKVIIPAGVVSPDQIIKFNAIKLKLNTILSNKSSLE